MRFDFGDIVLVPFPFTDQTAHKQRPAVVVSSRAYHDSRSDLIVMAITSQVHPGASYGDVAVLDRRAAGLLKPSAIKPVLATLDKRLVIKILGSLRPGDLASMREALARILG